MSIVSSKNIPLPVSTVYATPHNQRQGGLIYVDALIADRVLDDLTGAASFSEMLCQNLSQQYPKLTSILGENGSDVLVNFQRAEVDAAAMRKLNKQGATIKESVFKQAVAIWRDAPWANMVRNKLIPKVITGHISSVIDDEGGRMIETTVHQNRFKHFPSTQAEITLARREEAKWDTYILNQLYNGLEPDEYQQIKASQAMFNKRYPAGLQDMEKSQTITIPDTTPSASELEMLHERNSNEHNKVFPLIYYIPTLAQKRR